MLSTERREVMPISLVEYEMYLKEREKRLRQVGEVEAKPEGDKLLKLKSGWGEGKVYPNGVKAMFGTFVKVTDNSGRIARGTHVVYEKRKLFVPWERLTGVYPIDVAMTGLYGSSKKEPVKFFGVQLETDDLQTAVLVFPPEMQESVSTLKGAADAHWGRLYRNETIVGARHVKGSSEVTWYAISGDLYKPEWLRRTGGRTTASYDGFALSRSAPTMEPMMELDTSTLDGRTLKEWCKHTVTHLERTYGRAGEESWNDPQWWSERRALLERLTSQMDGLGTRKGGPRPCPDLYARIGEELIFSQYDKYLAPGPTEVWEPHDDIDLEVVNEALRVLDKAFRLDILRIEALKAKERVHQLLGEEGKAEACRNAWTRFRMVSPDGRGFVQVEGMSIGDHKSMLKDIKQGLKQRPKDPLLWYIQGVIYLQNAGRPKKAVKSFEKCIEADPGHNMAWFGKGRALEEMGQSGQAKQCFDRSGL